MDLRYKGYAACVEVGVVALQFKILKQLVTLFMRNYPRRYRRSSHRLRWT